jgi:hypothetical protein
LECCGKAAVGGHVGVEAGWVWFATHDVPILMPVLRAGSAIIEG